MPEPVGTHTTITCLVCGTRTETEMPSDARQYVWACPACDAVLRRIMNAGLRAPARRRRPGTVVRCAEDTLPNLDAIALALGAEPSITHVFVAHCETTTGILNPIEAIGRLARQAGGCYSVDAMSSFGALPIDLPGYGIDLLVRHRLPRDAG